LTEITAIRVGKCIPFLIDDVVVITLILTGLEKTINDAIRVANTLTTFVFSQGCKVVSGLVGFTVIGAVLGAGRRGTIDIARSETYALITNISVRKGLPLLIPHPLIETSHFTRRTENLRVFATNAERAPRYTLVDVTRMAERSTVQSRTFQFAFKTRAQVASIGSRPGLPILQNAISQGTTARLTQRNIALKHPLGAADAIHTIVYLRNILRWRIENPLISTDGLIILCFTAADAD
jgi:hypothetical protein